MKAINSIALSILFFMCLTLTHADTTEWELGIGLGAFDIPHYPGASDSKSYLLPVPFVVLKSDILEIEEGIRAKLFKSDKVRLNLSVDFGVPVNSEDSALRQGMPDLETVLQIGPSLELTLSGSRRQPYHFRLEIPVRYAFATDFEEVDNLGWILEPRLTYETRRPYKTGFSWLTSAGLRFASDDYHSYYYDVPIAFATASRPSFNTNGGYSGLFADLVGAWRHKDIIFWSFIRYQNLSGAEFIDSPLVAQKDYYFIGAGITWVFASNQ